MEPTKRTFNEYGNDVTKTDKPAASPAFPATPKLTRDANGKFISTGPRTTPATPKRKAGRPPKDPGTIPPPLVVEHDPAKLNPDLTAVETRVKLSGADTTGTSLPDELLLTNASAGMLVLLLDGIANLAFGDYARLNDKEKKLISEPLGRILTRLDPSRLGMINQYTDPVLLIMGLMAWVSRVALESKSKKPVEPIPDTGPTKLYPTDDFKSVEELTKAPAEVVNALGNSMSEDFVIKENL